MERSIKFEPGEYYHIYNRGVDKRPIFFSDSDWSYFQRLLYVRNDDGGHIKLDRLQNKALSEIKKNNLLVNIHAYALMPNHFHLLVSESEPDGISKFMGRLLTSYSMYINKKYDRTGPLMCRPYRAKHVVDEPYFRWLISYIHLNPLDYVAPDWEGQGVTNYAQAKECVKNYHFSSFQDYFGSNRDETVILDKTNLPIDVTELEDIHTMLNIQQIQHK